MNKIKQNRVFVMRNNVNTNFLNELEIDNENISTTNNCFSENKTETKLETHNENTDQFERRFLRGKDKTL